jgi:hypothetical protein
MDYCGVVPKRKINPTITGVILSCKCPSCISGSVSRRTNTKAKTHINLSKASIEEWRRAGRCPDMGILGMNDSTPSSSLSQDQILLDQDDKSAWTSSFSTEKDDLIMQTPPNKPRWKQRSFKSANRGLLTFRDIDRTPSSVKTKRHTKLDLMDDQDYLTNSNGAYHTSGMKKQEDHILIRFMDLLTPTLARRIPSTHICGVYHLVLCFEIRHTESVNQDTIILNPVHFQARCNPIKAGSSLLIGAAKALNSHETVLEEQSSESRNCVP